MGEKVAVGDVLAGKYRVEKILGSGGMGVVVAARHQQLDVLVALKFMADEALNEPDLVARFLREGRAAARLRSEHVARVTDVGTLGSGAPYQVMEYLDGSDLSLLLSSEGPQPIPSAVEYIVQACEALDEAHRAGIVHRDIKPSNLFLTRRPNGTACIKVLDFGISKSSRLGSSSAKLHATHARAVLGSPFYMAPEQMRAAREVDARADVWALGATLYELLTGRVPFEADSLLDLALRVAQADPISIRDSRSDVPWALEQIVLRCLEKDREDRFATVRVLAGALAPFAQRWSNVLQGVAPRSAWSAEARAEPSNDTLVDSSEDAVTRVAAAPVESEPVEESGRAESPSPRRVGSGLDRTRPSERSAPAPARTTLPMRAVEPSRALAGSVHIKADFASPLGSVPPVAHNAARGSLSGARLSWGQSQKFASRTGIASVGLLVLCGVIAALVLRPRQSPTSMREITRVRDTVSVSRAEPAPNRPALGTSPVAASSASTARSESATRIPTFAVNDLPSVPQPTMPPPLSRSVDIPAASSVPAAMQSKPDCAQPYYFDDRGHKRFKFECVESPSVDASVAALAQTSRPEGGPPPLASSANRSSDPPANPN